MKNLRKLSIVMLFLFSFVTFVNPITNVLAEENTKVTKKSEATEYKEGQVYNGFKLVKEEEIKDYNALGRLFVHEKTGATVFQFKNSDPNKFFSVSFKTPIDNDEGTPHVFEHALLTGGSKKYPIKQLVFKIMNGSVANFMNGLTYSDRTVYPFSTVDEEEFKNLMDVYLDMAFNAEIKSSENIFKEEAWHYELESEEDTLEAKGVVLSEMKGNASNSIRKLILAINRSLFPDTTYNYNSGGDPKHIPELTYEEVVEFYNKYYKPSNSFIFIYGDTPIEDKLQHINSEFFKDVENKENKVVIKTQEPYTEKKEYSEEYGSAEGQPTENLDYIALNYVLGDANSLDDLYAAYMFNVLVVGNNNSSFQKKMIEAGFSNVIANPSFSQAQSVFSFIALNTDHTKKDLFEKTVREALEEVLKEGIDEELLESTINNFSLQEKLGKSYTQSTGLNIFQVASRVFTYDGDIFEYFNGEDEALNKVKKAVDTKYFEKFIEDKILNNKYSSLVTLNAVPGLNEKDLKEEAEKLQKYKESLSNEEVKTLIKEYEELTAWRNTKESKEVLDRLPLLDTKALNPKVNIASTEIDRVNGIKVLYHPINTNGTNSIKLLFNTNSIEQDKIQYIKLLSSILGGLDTENYKNNEIVSNTLKYTNGIGYAAYVRGGDHKNTYEPVFQVSAISLNENMDKTLDLIRELILNANFDDKEKLRNLITQSKTSIEMQLDNNLLNYAVSKNFLRDSNSSAYEEEISGLKYYEFINDLYTNFDEKYDEITKNLKDVYQNIIDTESLTVSVTIEEKDYPVFEKNFKEFINDIESDRIAFKMLAPHKMPRQDKKRQNYVFDNEDKDTAFVAQSLVNYNVLSFNSKDLGFNLDSNNKVITAIVNDFLFNSHRVKGKAYGAFMIGSDKGTIAFGTYRDPRLKDSFEDFKGLPEYLRNKENYEAKLNQYKLDALKKFYMPKSVYDLANEADGMYFASLSEIDYLKELDEILNMTVEDVQAYGDLFEEGIKNGRITTIGGKELIEQDKDLFEEVKNLLD
ncbi:insulinase family protein [Oceanirhabdus seepicola]|uniref:Insulinase family protein n=1 Tax=Oceanirhabdus seepicola TaxID=2828781 RepID=A0A9J6P0C8_9CLOT|nr:insulinase family protein [Oceanirhabdus seepicola]MCM1989569.1 insulinase family protein [Oceanirhabdus seepicola]